MPSFRSSPWILGAPHRGFAAAIFLTRAVINLGVDGRAAPGGPAGELGPVLAEAAPLPPQNGSRGYDDEGLPPPCPDPGQPDPEEAIRRAKLGPGCRPPVHGELVAQGQVLEGELAMAAAKEREESKQVEQEGDHRAEILSGSASCSTCFDSSRSFAAAIASSPSRTWRSRSRWSKRVIIELRFSPDQRRQINDLPPAEVLAKDTVVSNGSARLSSIIVYRPVTCSDSL